MRGKSAGSILFFLVYVFRFSPRVIETIVTSYGYTDYQALCSVSLDYEVQVYVFVCLYIGLAVKLPQMSFHDYHRRM